MWAGAIVDIPDGFVFCNGANGTPNLRSRFIVGAGDGYAVNDTGGADSHTHTASGKLVDPCLAEGPMIASGADYEDCLGSDQVDVTVDAAANRPKWYALAYIMKT